MIKIYAIENYTSQLANSVVYRDADMTEITRVIGSRGGRYDLYDNCYILGNLRIYIDSKNAYDVWDKSYEEYPMQQFIKDARKMVPKLKRPHRIKKG